MNTEAYNMVLCLSRLLSKQGTMEPCLGADNMTLQVVKRCSLADFARHFTKFKNNTPGMVSCVGVLWMLSSRHRLVGLVVMVSASRAEDLGFESRLRRIFFRVESY